MKKTPLRAALVLAMVAGLTLSGCSMLAPQDQKPTTDAGTNAPTDKPSDNSGDKTVEPKDDGASAPSDKLAEPGATVKMGKWASYEYTGTDKQTAIIAARLVSIDKVTSAQYDLLVKEIPQLAGYTVWLVKVEQKKVSGASIVYNADFTAFKAINVNKTRVQAVTVIGWDDCNVESFTKEFDDDGATITQCIIGATQPGDNDVAGVQYSQYNTPYDNYDGNPIAFLK